MTIEYLDLADSALHAASAGFGDDDFYLDFVDKAAVLIVRLAKNHPLPDGNKRAAWVALRLFVDINGWRWEPAPCVDDAEAAVRRMSARDPRDLASLVSGGNFWRASCVGPTSALLVGRRGGCLSARPTNRRRR